MIQFQCDLDRSIISKKRTKIKLQYIHLLLWINIRFQLRVSRFSKDQNMLGVSKTNKKCWVLERLCKGKKGRLGIKWRVLIAWKQQTLNYYINMHYVKEGSLSGLYEEETREWKSLQKLSKFFTIPILTQTYPFDRQLTLPFCLCIYWYDCNGNSRAQWYTCEQEKRIHCRKKLTWLPKQPICKI